MKKILILAILFSIVFAFAPAVIWHNNIPSICIPGENSFIAIYDRNLTLIDSLFISGPILQKIAWEPVDSEVIIIGSTANGWIVILTWNGEYLEIVEQVELSDTNPYSAPVLADIDNNGSVEIIAAHDTALFCLDVSGNILWHAPIESEYPPVATPAVGDIDGDSLLEIVIETYEALWAFNGDGTILPNFPVYLSEFDSYAKFSYSSPILWDSDNDNRCEIYAGLHQAGATYDWGLFGGWDETGARITNGFYGTSGYGAWVYSPISICDPDGDGIAEMVFADIRGSIYGVNSSMSLQAFGNTIFNSGAGSTWGGVLCCDVNSQAGSEYIFVAFSDDTSMRICAVDNSKQWIGGFPETVIVDDDAIISPAIFTYDDTIHIVFAYSDGRIWQKKLPGTPLVGQTYWCELFGDRRNTGCASPLPPRNLVAERIGDSIRIQWSSVFDAKSYFVFRSADSAGVYAETILTTVDTFIDVLFDTSWFFVISQGEFKSSFRSISVRVIDTTNVTESYNKENSDIVVVFPNPANAIAQIWSPNSVRLEIVNISGRTLKQAEMNDGRMDFNFSEIPSGVYMIATFDEKNRRIGQAKVVVLK